MALALASPARAAAITGRPLSLVALGDSISCGQGVGVHVAPDSTWPVLLAAALGAAPVVLATPGARVRDVLTEQLRPALAVQPDIVTLLVGLNDVLWAGSCAVGPELVEVLAPLRATTVLVVRLHDPTELLPLPAAARAGVLRRVGQVNAAVDAAATAAGARVIDLAALPALRRRDAWAVDRLHPNPHGHALIAAAAGTALGLPGAPAGPAPGAPPARSAELAWVARHGLPYLAGHGRRLAPGALAALARR